MTTLAALLTPRSRETIRDELLTVLGALGFPVTSWRSGGTARTLVELVAGAAADAWSLSATVARGSLLGLSEADWLTALAESHYLNTRLPATFTRGYVHLAAAPSAGPYQIAPAGLVVSDGTRFYRSTNTTLLTLPAGGSLDVEVQAERAGAEYNVASVTILVSPALPGVTLTSPAYGGGATWRTADGRDLETDVALRLRCRDKWATLSESGATEAWYRYHARSALDASGTPVGASRVSIVPGPGDGTLQVIVAGASGPLGGGDVSDIQAWIDARHPPTDLPTVVAAAAYTIPLTGTVRFRAGYNTSANRAAVHDAIRAYVNSLDIGDWVGGVEVDLAGIHAAIYSAVPGAVADVDLTFPTGDLVVSADQVAVADTLGLTFAP